MLFEPNVWRGLSMNNYNLWAAEIWHILVLRATRRPVHAIALANLIRSSIPLEVRFVSSVNSYNHEDQPVISILKSTLTT